MRTNSLKSESVFNIRSMPAAVEAEESLISSCLLGNAAEVLEHVSSGEFYRTDHQVIVRAIEGLSARREPVDLITVTESLRNSGELEQAGGATHIARIQDTVPIAIDIPHYCRMVKQAAQRREIISRCNDIARAAFGEPDHGVLMDQAQRAFLDIDDNSRTDTSQSFEALTYSQTEVWERLKDKGGMTGIPTGLSKLDCATGGWQQGDLIVLAARPAMGKTSFAMGRAASAACVGLPVHIISLEMGAGQLFDRVVADLARVDLQKFRLGNFSQSDWGRLTDALETLHKWPITIEHAHGWSVTQIVRCVRRRWREHGTKLIVIDYLQLIRGNPNAQRKDLEIAEITRALKALAVELSIPVILLSQLNRRLEERNDRRPKLSDLRDSGAIEQDCDLCLFIYRDEVYYPDSPDKGVAELSIAKHRNGPELMFRLAWIGWRCSFQNLAP